MADSRELRLFAARAHAVLLALAEEDVRAALGEGDPETARAVAQAGRHAKGRRRVAEHRAYAAFLRLVVTCFVEARDWPAVAVEHCVNSTAGRDEPAVPTSLRAQARDVLSPEACQRPEVLGWLHQHWHSERRRRIYRNLGTVRADADELRAVTQVFTPDWVARTLVDNSVSRFRGDGHRAPYALSPASGKPGVPRVLDPACGTGHLLTHAFDELASLLAATGVAPTEIPARVLADHLVGWDVDPDVVRIARFVVLVKAWDLIGAPDSPAALSLPAPRVHTLRAVTFTAAERRTLVRHVPGTDEAFWNAFVDADVMGALIRPARLDLHLPDAVPETVPEAVPDALRERADRVLAQTRWLHDTFDVVVANPPYLGTRHMGDRLRTLAALHHPVTKGDLCTMFLERTLELVRPGGYAAVVASESWFVTTRTRRVRDLLLGRAHLRTAVSIDGAAFGVRVNTVATVLQRPQHDGDAPPETLFTRVGRHDLTAAPAGLPVSGRDVVRHHVSVFDSVPDRVLVFDLPPALLALYAKGVVLGDVVGLRQGMATTDNARFVRRWWEVPADEIVRGLGPGQRHHHARWVPYNKGGSAVRWWGNQEYVVLWENDAEELRRVRPAATIEDKDFFRPSVSWSNIGRNGVQFRHYPAGFVFDVAGMSAFVDDERTHLNLLGYLNSPLVRAATDVLAPTLNYQVGDIARLPAPELSTSDDHLRVRELIALTRAVWCQEPTSWEHLGHPVLLRDEATLVDRARAHVAEREATLARIRDLETASAHHWADLVEEITGVAVTHRDPGPSTLPPTRAVEVLVAEAEHLLAIGATALDPSR